MDAAPKTNAKAGGTDPDEKLLLKLELPSDPGLLCAVRGAVERLAEAFGFSGSDCRAVTRAVDEALTNIIRHSYSGAVDRPIELRIQATTEPAENQAAGKGLEILLSDRGPAIDPEKMCGRKLEDVKPGGLGLHFIKESMDVVEFRRVDGANCLRLVKYLHPPKERSHS